VNHVEILSVYFVRHFVKNNLGRLKHCLTVFCSLLIHVKMCCSILAFWMKLLLILEGETTVGGYSL